MWSNEIDRLSLFEKTEPHAAFAALTHRLMSRWTYLLCCTEGISPLLQPLEQNILSQFIPSLTGRPEPNEDERALLALPARLGGLEITNPTSSLAAYSQSCALSGPLIDLILKQSTDLGCAREQQKNKSSQP